MWGSLKYHYYSGLVTQVQKINLASAVYPKKKKKWICSFVIRPLHGSDPYFMRLWYQWDFCLASEAFSKLQIILLWIRKKWTQWIILLSPIHRFIPDAIGCLWGSIQFPKFFDIEFYLYMIFFIHSIGIHLLHNRCYSSTILSTVVGHLWYSWTVLLI